MTPPATSIWTAAPANGEVSVLFRFEYTVPSAHDGPTAPAMVAQQRPEVVSLDLGLPGMSGHEVARAWTGRGDPRLVAMTGSAEHDRARESGVNAELVKPVDPEDRLRVLTELGGR